MSDLSTVEALNNITDWVFDEALEMFVPAYSDFWGGRRPYIRDSEYDRVEQKRKERQENIKENKNNKTSPKRSAESKL